MATPYRDAQVADSPSGLWLLDETSGTTAASFVNTPTLDGTYTGTYTLGVADATITDTGNNAISFVQTGYVDIPASSILNIRSAITIEAIIKPTNTHNGTIYNHPTSTNTWSNQAQLYLSGGKVWFELFGPGFAPQLYWNHTAFTGTRFHLLARWTGTRMDMFVNGNLVATVATAAVTLNDGASANARIGHLGTTNVYAFNGMIDNVAVYPTALSDARVAAHVAALNPGNARSTQSALETIVIPTTTPVRTTQTGAEVVVNPSIPTRVTQFGTELVVNPNIPTRVTQYAMEVIYLYVAMVPGIASPGMGWVGIQPPSSRAGLSSGMSTSGIPSGAGAAGIPKGSASAGITPGTARTRTE